MQRDDGAKKALGRLSLKKATAGGEIAAPAAALVRKRLAELASKTAVPGLDLDAMVLSLEPLSLVPEEIATRHRVLPVAEVEGRLWLAMADPTRRRLVDEVEFVTGQHVFPCVVPDDVLDRVLREAYRAVRRGEGTWCGPRAEGEEPTDPAEAIVQPQEQDTSSVRPASAAPLAGLASPGMPSEVLEDGGEAHAPGPGASRRVRSGPPRVLVVDDEDDIRKLLGCVLRQKGYEVLEASDGRQAMEQMDSGAPDVVLLDAMLPEVHGFDICRRIKRDPRFAHVPVVMVSAVYRGWRIAADLKQSYGVEAFLEKPFKIADVLAAVEGALASGGGSGSPTGGEEPLSERARQLLQEGLRAYHRGEGDRAVEMLREAAESDPYAFEPHYQLGLLFGHCGELFEAIGALERAVELRSGHLQALRALAVLYQRTGFRHKAIEMWERALSAAVDDATRRAIKEQLLELL